MEERHFLTKEQLKQMVPAVFTTTPSKSVSNRYAFVPTYKIIEDFEKLGWKPVAAKTVKSKKDLKLSKHSIRFAKKEGKLDVDEMIEEIHVLNSHDRSFRLEVDMGIFRCICSNQATIADSTFSNILQKHINVEFADIKRIIKEAAKQFKGLSEKIAKYRTIQLTEIEKDKFAHVAKQINWNLGIDMSPKLLLNSRRAEDEKNDLWTVFNVIQENITKGGIQFKAKSKKTGKVRARSTKGIKNIVRDLRVNKELWMLMEAFAVTRSFK